MPGTAPAPGATPAAAAAVPTLPAPAAPPAPVVPKHPIRIYAARGVTKGGRTGAPSARVQLPVVPLTAAPSALTARVTEAAVVLDWKPPADAPASIAFNVYRAEEPMQPINPAPLTAPAYEVTGAKLGEEQCFRVRTVLLSDAVALEGPLSDAQCVTPRDVFAPAAPKNLQAVPTPGQINLIWDASTEKDLAGYLVLRGEAAGGDLQAITPAPIKEASYRDTTVTPGVRYVYAIVAVDTASPVNTSAQSPRVEETAR